MQKELDESKYLDPVFLSLGEEVYSYDYIEQLRAENLRLKKIPDARIWNLVPQAGFQEAVMTNDADIMLIGGKRGGGKVLPNDADIITPFGIRKNGDLKIGDIITDPTTGGMERVIDIYEHPQHDFYEVEFDDGSKVECGLEHLWKVRQTGHTHKRRHLYGLEVEDDYRIWTFGMIKRWLDDQQDGKHVGKESKKHLVIPPTEPVKFTKAGKSMKRNDIDPYVIGALIGDGTITESVRECYDAILTSADAEIVEQFKKAGVNMSHFSKKGSVGTYYIKDAKVGEMLTLTKLSGCRSENKFIPTCYKYATVDERFALVQGLMDTDGYIDPKGKTISFTTVSKRLAEDMQFVLRSLGASAKITIDTNTGYKDKDGKRVKCKDAYTVYIRIKDASRLFRLPRKKARCTPFNGGISEVARRIVGYRHIGIKDGRCIRVDGTASLYLTNDFIVTHNSWVALAMMLRYAFLANAKMFAFRRFKDDIENTIWEASSRVFPGFGVPTKSNFTWTFPSGATLTMTHIADAKEVKNRFRGAEAACIDIEELPEHTTNNLDVLRDLAAACRSTLGVKPKLIGTFNPIYPEHPLYQLISWWIDPDTDQFIHERSGIIRYLFFYGKDADEFVMGDSKEEVYQDPRVRSAIDEVIRVTGQSYEKLISSFTVIEGDYSDNKILQEVDPTYLAKLAVAGTAALLRDTAGLYRRIDEGDSQLSSYDMERFFNASEKKDGVMRASCDVAITGDFLVIWAFNGHHICDMEMRRGGLSDDIIPFIENFLSRNGVRKENFTYDSNGLGLWLRESAAFKNRAVEFNNKSASSDSRLWNNLKSECCEKFVRAIKADEFSIEPDILKKTLRDKRGRFYTVRDRLLEERRALKRKEDAPRYEIIDKKQMKQIVGHSPDFIEGLMMVMHLFGRSGEMVREGFEFLF